MTHNPEELKQKYESVLSAIRQQGVRLAQIYMREDKLVLLGAAPSEQAKKIIWNKVKTVDPSYSDIELHLKVNPALASAQQAGATAGGGLQAYTVEAGDTLSTIAQHFYGDAEQYMRIVEANRDRLKDPDNIQAGQELYIPVARTHCLYI